ncbi:hypothetical protein NIES4103_36710 [Nostoc sp. NIES-4103]|nr:hypothetical protein NIES4103_36710 [Nostoc sp. NIES-4103]
MFSRFSRRQVLTIASFTITGTAVAINIPFFKNLFAPKAQAQEISEKVYKGRRYKIIKNQTPGRNGTINNTVDTSTQLFIDDKEIKIFQHKKTKKYTSSLLFGEFESPEKIAKIVIDLGLKFPEKEVELDPEID